MEKGYDFLLGRLHFTGNDGYQNFLEKNHWEKSINDNLSDFSSSGESDEEYIRVG